MRENKPDEKELLFCRLCADGMTASEAAVRSGIHKTQTPKAEALLLRRDIKNRIENLRAEKNDVFSEVCAGYRRLAFTGAADAVRLISLLTQAPDASVDQSALEKMDLFCVSEIKLSRGSAEIKLYDRMRALEGLLAAAEKGNNDRAVPLYSAISKGADMLNKQRTEDSGENL